MSLDKLQEENTYLRSEMERYHQESRDSAKVVGGILRVLRDNGLITGWRDPEPASNQGLGLSVAREYLSEVEGFMAAEHREKCGGDHSDPDGYGLSRCTNIVCRDHVKYLEAQWARLS